ncbi:ALBINO3-like protein 2, chloroplastic [Panicum miliaceum]|uniref:ALBINO3-like protein 2, chloroplastic n=1 Tax=Panicum miliaceum TaxID=4540 RepID=A0A3L6PEJ5_PANMI|nr:ALBINO3-like protein 2, chloroplastic [Panicum miliaceum]
MALAIRLLGRRRLLPPPLPAAVAHLSAATQNPSHHHHHHHHHPLPSPTLPLPPRELPAFALQSRSFSWYSRSSSGSSPSPGTAAAYNSGEEAYTEKESVFLDNAHIVDGEEDVASAAGAAADAVGGAAGATAEGVGGVSGLAVSTMSDLMDGFHNLTGLPWWITISLSTVAMRLFILPTLIVQLQKTAKIGQIMQKLSPSLPPPQPGSNFREQYALFQRKMKELRCPSFLWNFAYFSVQGGILWFHDLTEFPHGTLGPIFPILVAGLHYLNVQGSQIKHHQGIFGLLAKYYRIYLDVLTIPLFLIAYVVPQGSLVYWTTNGLFSVAQQLSLRNSAVRKLLGLPDIRAQVGRRAEKSPLEGPKTMQRPLLEDANLQTELTPSDNGTASESTIPNFVLESMEGNISESSSTEELLEQALQYLGTGRRDQAIPLIRTAVERNPDLSTALIGMGQTLFSNRLFPEASECFKHAIEKIQEDDPLLVLALFGAGLSHERQGDNEMAIKLLQRIAELKEPEKPINKTCYFQGMVILGSILSREGRNSEAAKYLQMATAYDPSVERLLKECEEGMDDQPKSEEK